MISVKNVHDDVYFVDSWLVTDRECLVDKLVCKLTKLIVKGLLTMDDNDQQIQRYQDGGKYGFIPARSWQSKENSWFISWLIIGKTAHHLGKQGEAASALAAA